MLFVVNLREWSNDPETDWRSARYIICSCKADRDKGAPKNEEEFFIYFLNFFGVTDTSHYLYVKTILRRTIMARKSLLTENEIRQFMKLADLTPIGTSRLSEMGYPPGARDEEDELEAELGATEDELGAEDDFADEEGDELADLGAEDELGDDLGAEGGGDMVSVDDFMSALETALEDALGEPTSIEMDDAGDEEELGVEDEEDMAMDMGGDELGVGMEDEEEIVAEVARRVAKRLVSQKKSDDIANQLAERIFQRLTK